MRTSPNKQLPSQRLVDNWLKTLAEVADAARVSGREPESVRVIGVSKYVDAEMTGALREAGCVDLGESRPQQLMEKTSAIGRDDITWHLIGHLQRNKSRRMVELVDWIHSVDTLKLLHTIDSHAEQLGRAPKLLIEVNISGDEEKHGFRPDELLEAWPQIAEATHVEIRGLMSMAGLEAGPEQARAQFAAVRELRDSLEKRYQVSLPELSMGMSGDFREAIAEGATMVRIGSRLFDGVMV